MKDGMQQAKRYCFTNGIGIKRILTLLLFSGTVSFSQEFQIEDYERICKLGISEKVLFQNLESVQKEVPQLEIKNDSILIEHLRYANLLGALFNGHQRKIGSVFGSSAEEWSPEFVETLNSFNATRAYIDSLGLLGAAPSSQSGGKLLLRVAGAVAGTFSVAFFYFNFPEFSDHTLATALGLGAVSGLCFYLGHEGNDSGQGRREKLSDLTVRALFEYNGHAIVSSIQKKKRSGH